MYFLKNSFWAGRGVGVREKMFVVFINLFLVVLNIGENLVKFFLSIFGLRIRGRK